MKIARKLVHLLQEIVPDGGSGVHILAYHLIEGGTAFPVDISAKVFTRQMKELRSLATICSLEEAIRKLESGTVEDTVAVVTFDDAYENFYSVAWPVLREWNIPSTLYVPVDFVEGRSPAFVAGSVLPPCSWEQLAELAGSGLVSIGSHTCSHPNLRKADAKTVEYEVVESRKRLEEKLGIEVASFCYPRGLWSNRVESIVRKSYDSAVIGGGRKMQPGKWNRYRLNRIPIRKNMPVDLGLVLGSAVWLEERVASSIRPWISGVKRDRKYW